MIIMADILHEKELGRKMTMYVQTCIFILPPFSNSAKRNLKILMEIVMATSANYNIRRQVIKSKRN